MSNLAILQWARAKREVNFVGYNREHTACFIRDEQNARRAITLSLPSFFHLHFRENPVGKHGSPPVEIARAPLHVPACFTNEAEKAKYDDPNSDEVQCTRIVGHDLWKSVTRHKCWLSPKDDKKLSELLRDELQRWRLRYDIRERETAEQIAAINKEIALLPSGHSAHVLQFHQNRINELRNMLRGEFTTFSEGKNGAIKYISIFDTTLDMVRHGWGGLREKMLEREWAEHFGLKLEAIPPEAAAFRAWIGRLVYNAHQKTTDLNTRTVEIGVGLKLDPWQWEILEAAVLYEIRFADGSRCWLDDIEERGVTDPQEVEDFERIEQATEIAGDERMTLDEVCRNLPVKWKGESKPMGKKGLQKLCEKAGVSFKFPMRRSLVRKLNEHRQRQNRKRAERLKRHAAK